MPTDTSQGWAVRTVEDALRFGSLFGIALAPIALVATFPVSALNVPALTLVAAHVSYSLLAATTIRRGWDVRVALLGFYALLLGDLLASADSVQPIAVLAMWFAFVITGTPGLLLETRSSAVVSFGSSLAMAVTLALARPDLTHDVPVALVVGTAATWPAGVVFRKVLRTLAARTEHQEAVAARELQRLVVAQSTSRNLAEDARVLHDSLINTLGAIASGGVWTRDTDVIRRWCRRDAEAVRLLLAGHERPPAGVEDLATHSVRVRRTGLRGAELARQSAFLHGDTSRALAEAARELVRNAVQHARASEVVVDVRREGDEIRVTVSDDGTGFDGRTIPGHGLAESVVARVVSCGGRVQIDGGQGRGATILIAASLERPRESGHDPRLEDEVAHREAEVQRLRQTACWCWATMINAAGVIIEVGNRPGRFTEAWLALAVVSGLCWLAWCVTRTRERLPTGVTLLVIGGVAAGYLFGLAGVDAGRDQPYLWHPIGLTPLLIILLVLAKTRLAVVAGTLTLAVVTLASAATAATAGSDDRAVMMLSLGLTQGCQLLAWMVFHGVLGRLGRRLANDQRRAEASQRSAASREAVVKARQRWLLAGVRTSVELLEAIASGDVDPAGPSCRANCDDDERYLRQLTMISPELVHLSTWLAQALAEARSRRVRLTLRPGDTDIADPSVANQLGRVLLGIVSEAPAGSELTLSLFSAASTPELHVLGPAGCAPLERPDRALPSGWTLTRTRLDAHTLLVVELSASASRSRTSVPVG